MSRSEAAPLKVVTINLLSDLERWGERRELLAAELSALQPDLVAVQEVALPENTAAWLGSRLGMQVFMQPKTGQGGETEGIAILSRLPVESADWLDLGSQDRVAQRVRVRHAEQELIFTNGHFYLHPGAVPERRRQVERLLDWLAPCEGQGIIVCGDFNCPPECEEIALMHRKFTSAFSAAWGHEPVYTMPTPLKRPLLNKLTSVFGFLSDLHPAYLRPWVHATLDYIFVSPQIQVLAAGLAFNNPAPHDPALFASDHYGLYAELVPGEATD